MSKVPTHQKSSNALQAQAASFAAERIEDAQDSDHILMNLGSLAAGEIVDVVRTTRSTGYHRDADGKSVLVPEGTDRVVATPKEFLSYIQSVGGSSYEGISVRKEMLDNYTEFKPVVDKLRAEIEDPATREEHSSLLGSGSNSVVFNIEHNGKQYAVRVPNGKGVKPSIIDSHIAGAVLGKSVPHLEQIVAGSYEDGVTVAEIMPGKEMGDLSVEDVSQISDQQLDDWVDTIITISQRGIEIDPKPSNVFYDVKEGFGFVDFHSSKVAGKSSADQNLGQIAGWMVTPITNAGFYGKPYNSERSEEDYTADLQQHKVNLGVLKRYRTAVEKGLPETEKDEALNRIDSTIVTMQQTVDNYASLTWVAERIAQDAKDKIKRKEMAKQYADTGWDLV